MPLAQEFRHCPGNAIPGNGKQGWSPTVPSPQRAVIGWQLFAQFRAERDLAIFATFEARAERRVLHPRVLESDGDRFE